MKRLLITGLLGLTLINNVHANTKETIKILNEAAGMTAGVVIGGLLPIAFINKIPSYYTPADVKAAQLDRALICTVICGALTLATAYLHNTYETSSPHEMIKPDILTSSLRTAFCFCTVSLGLLSAFIAKNQ